MPATARLELTLDATEKDTISRAASLVGTTVSAFVRMVVKEKAQALLEQDTRVTMTQKDFARFSNAIQGAFAPNKALKGAIAAAAKVRRA